MKKLFFLLTALLACTTPRKAAHPATYYTEPQRPQFHFSPEKMWMNDPNGMVYFKGEYHLFYQYYPGDVVWGPMHWGHAVTRDLVHWEHLPIALYPDSLGLIFSGSAVVDWKNTSGFGKNGEPPLVAMFTHHLMAGEKAGRNDFQYQSLAYSNDRGRTWTTYPGNPVIPNPGIRDFRDTKVLWHEPSRRWVVVLSAGDHVLFYHSPDLKTWTKTGEFGEGQGSHGGIWECPDLFELPVGRTGAKQWVLLVSINDGTPNGGSGTQYFVGDFDGKTFRNTNAPDKVLWFDYGRDNYAGVTWSDAPDERRLFLGWMSNWQYAQQVPTSPWRSAMTFPLELALDTTAAGPRLLANPVRELLKLRQNEHKIARQTFEKEVLISSDVAVHEILLGVDLASTTAREFGIKLANDHGQEVLIGYETATRRLFIDRSRSGNTLFSPQFGGRHYAPRASDSPVLHLRLLTDLSSAELFADYGRTNLTELFFPTQEFRKVSLYALDGKVAVLDGRRFALKRVW